jgi:hypothetical protein
MPKAESPWKSDGLAWPVIGGLATLLIALAVVNLFDEPFERVVIDLLVLIYAAVRFTAVSQGFFAYQETRINRTNLEDILKAVGASGLPEEEREKHWAHDARFENKGIVQFVFICLIALVALVNLVGAFLTRAFGAG